MLVIYNQFLHNGLLEKGQLDQRTNYYAITAAGVAQLRTHREWVARHVEP